MGAVMLAVIEAVISLGPTPLRAPCHAVSSLREDWNRPSHETEQSNYRNELGHRCLPFDSALFGCPLRLFLPQKGAADQLQATVGRREVRAEGARDGEPLDAVEEVRVFRPREAGEGD